MFSVEEKQCLYVVNVLLYAFSLNCQYWIVKLNRQARKLTFDLCLHSDSTPWITGSGGILFRNCFFVNRFFVQVVEQL